MRPLRLYILEDEIITQEILRESLEGYGYVICGMADNAEQALIEIERLKPDLAILDIHVKGTKDGVWLAAQLDIPFIFLTAFSDSRTVSTALDTKPHSYLIKPFENMQVFAAIEIALRSASNISHTGQISEDESEMLKVNNEILIQDGKIYYKVDLDEILYIKVEGKHLEIKLEDKRLVIRYSMARFVTEFDPSNLIQVHRAYLVNWQKVESLSSEELQIAGITIPVSRNYRSQVLERLQS